jgi:predicted DNA-binding antitoxin AbrB/MazE fold protein
MSMITDAIYEGGVLKPLAPLSLPDKSHVRITIEWTVREQEGRDWLELSRHALQKTWNNSADDVFNELLQK